MEWYFTISNYIVPYLTLFTIVLSEYVIVFYHVTMIHCMTQESEPPNVITRLLSFVNKTPWTLM